MPGIPPRLGPSSNGRWCSTPPRLMPGGFSRACHRVEAANSRPGDARRGNVALRCALVDAEYCWKNRVLKSKSVASQTQDDGFHEIQLNGKQLVFLFMAATVVSVVIFLCGVLVGRGVRVERAATVADSSSASIEPAPPSSAAAPVTPAGSDPTTAAPPPAVDDPSFFNPLEKHAPAVRNITAPPASKSQPAAAPPAPFVAPAATSSVPPSP